MSPQRLVVPVLSARVAEEETSVTRSSATIPFPIRGTIFALVVITVSAGLTFGSSGLPPGPRSAEATFLSEVKKLVAPERKDGDEFGYSVAISGDTAIVAEFGDSPLFAFAAGSAHIYQRNQGGADNWGKLVTLIAAENGHGDIFGFSVAISGDTAVVGAPNGAAAYVFQRDEGGADNWGEVKTLIASGTGGQFGRSVAVSDDTVVVGAISEAANAGAAYIFQRDEGGADNWGEVKRITASDAEATDQFGGTAAISGDTAVVGAHAEDAAGSSAGAAYVFQRNVGGTDNWGEVKKLTASDAQAGDFFGISVAISGETGVVGAFAEDAGGASAGAAYVFQRDQGGTDNWGEVVKLSASDAEAGDGFGRRLAFSGNTAVVGAPGEGTGGENAGAAYAFQRDAGGQDNWGEVIKLTASDADGDDLFGWGVAVDGDTTVVGARTEDFGAFEPGVGAAYVFDLPSPKIATSDTDGDTIVNSVDLDDDNDGCTDVQENSKDATLGGLRNPHNPWDFYDVLGPGAALPLDQIIDLPNDILGVIQHFAPLGTEPEYDAAFDRGPSAGPNLWNMTAPDGVIDLPNDILGVIMQFNHSCQ